MRSAGVAPAALAHRHRHRPRGTLTDGITDNSRIPRRPPAIGHAGAADRPVLSAENELARLRALLAGTRLERDELARRWPPSPTSRR